MPPTRALGCDPCDTLRGSPHAAAVEGNSVGLEFVGERENALQPKPSAIAPIKPDLRQVSVLAPKFRKLLHDDVGVLSLVHLATGTHGPGVPHVEVRVAVHLPCHAQKKRAHTLRQGAQG